MKATVAAVLLGLQMSQASSLHGAVHGHKEAAQAISKHQVERRQELKSFLEKHVQEDMVKARVKAKKVATEDASEVTLTRKLATFNTGYLVVNFYPTNQCKSSPEEYGIHLGTCYSDENSGDSLSYSCSVDDSTGVVTLTTNSYGSTTDCTGSVTTYTRTANGCELDTDDDDYDDDDDDDDYVNPTPYRYVSCTTNNNAWKKNKNSIASVSYEDPTECAAGTDNALDYYSTDLGYCFNVGTESYKWKSCKSLQYSLDSNSCSGTVISVPNELETCTADDDDYDDDFDDDYEGVSTEYCNESDDDDDSVCFSGQSTVQLESGETKSIASVSIGDRVLTVNSNGDKVFADVVFTPHQENSDAATFVTVKTASGNTVRMTKEHLLPAGDCASTPTELPFVRADEVRQGMCVHAVQGMDKVLFVSQLTSTGTYTIVTSEMSGKVVVDGVVASSFGVNHAAANAYYNIHRGVYALFNALGMSKSVFSASALVQSNAIFGEAVLYVGKAVGLV